MKHWILLAAFTAASCGTQSDDASPSDSSQTQDVAVDSMAKADNAASTDMAKIDNDAATRREAYTVCAACHLPTGQGIPGAFPPIRNRAREMALLDGGREYLIGSVTFGLMGQINAGGQTYFGVMAGQNSTLDSQAIANALNHVVLDLVDDGGASPVNPFTAVEVDGVKGQWGSAGPNKAGELRGQLLETHGDDWPQ